MPHQFQISRDSQALYITIIAKDRLPVFRTDAIKEIVCRALDEARSSGNFLLFAYVIMLDHLHLITSQPTTSSDVLRRTKGITARRVIDYLKGKQLRPLIGEVTASGVEERTQIFSLATGEKCFLDIQ